MIVIIWVRENSDLDQVKNILEGVEISVEVGGSQVADLKK